MRDPGGWFGAQNEPYARPMRRGPRHQLLVACAWCSRVELDGWVAEDQALRRLRTYEWGRPPRFTHSICDECLERLLKRREMGLVEGEAA